MRQEVEEAINLSSDRVIRRAPRFSQVRNVLMIMLLLRFSRSSLPCERVRGSLCLLLLVLRSLLRNKFALAVILLFSEDSMSKTLAPELLHLLLRHRTTEL